jgi:hypothetical protein
MFNIIYKSVSAYCSPPISYTESIRQTLVPLSLKRDCGTRLSQIFLSRRAEILEFEVRLDAAYLNVAACGKLTNLNYFKG